MKNCVFVVIVGLKLLGGVGCLGAAQGTTPVPVLPAFDVVAAPIVSETTLNAFGFQTTSVGREQIDALNAGDLASALRRTPGATISRYNTVGAFGGGEGGAVFLRGLGSSRPGGEIKTTLDGVPIGNGVFNHPLLDLLPVDLAGTVEVHRRAEPLSAGNMFAGINLVSPRGGPIGAWLHGMASVGSFGARSGKLAVGRRFAAGEIYAGQSYREAEGHREDADGRLVHTLVRASWSPMPKLALSYLVHWTDNRATDPGAEAGAGLPPTRGDVYETKAWLHLATAVWTRSGGEGSLRAYVNDGDANWLRRATSANADSVNAYRLSGVHWRETQQWGTGGEWVGGVDADWTEGNTLSVPPGAAGRTLAFGPETFRLLSAYAGINQKWSLAEGWAITPSAGVRHYRHEQFGRAWTPQVAVTARRGPWQAHASVARAVNFPGIEVAAFSTVAIPALGQSWRTLRPERLTQTEVGLRYELAPGAVAEVTVFQNEGRDRFVFVPPPPPPFRFLNVESSRTRGAELTFSVRPLKTLSLFAGAARLDATPADQPYAPRWSLTGGVTWQLRRDLTLNVDGSYVSAQHAGAQARGSGALNTERIGAFALLNARLAHAFSLGGTLQKNEVFVAIENALDRDYRYRPGYPMPETGFTVGVSARL